MVSLATVMALLQTHGYALLAPLAVLEGPIVTVIAAYLASLAYLNVVVVYGVVVLADLVGDSILYAIGRRGPAILPARWRARLGAGDAPLAALAAHFHRAGGRTLLLGKLTHSAGAVVLIAAGAARMPFWRFLWFNLLGTLPKSLVLVAIGFSLGQFYVRINGWIFRASFLALIVVAVAAIWWLRRGKAPPP